MNGEQLIHATIQASNKNAEQIGVLVTAIQRDHEAAQAQYQAQKARLEALQEEHRSRSEEHASLGKAFHSLSVWQRVFLTMIGLGGLLYGVLQAIAAWAR